MTSSSSLGCRGSQTVAAAPARPRDVLRQSWCRLGFSGKLFCGIRKSFQCYVGSGPCVNVFPLFSLCFGPQPESSAIGSCNYHTCQVALPQKGTLHQDEPHRHRHRPFQLLHFLPKIERRCRLACTGQGHTQNKTHKHTQKKHGVAAQPLRSGIKGSATAKTQYRGPKSCPGHSLIDNTYFEAKTCSEPKLYSLKHYMSQEFVRMICISEAVGKA